MEYQELIKNLSPTWQKRNFFNATTSSLSQFELPEIIEIEPIHFCNFNCIMCHVHFEQKMSRKKLDLNLMAKHLSHPAFKNKWLLVASGYEGTAHPDFATFINRVSDYGMKIEMTTNGSLLTNKLISQIKGCNFRYVTFSFDGIHKESYEYIREGANFTQTLDRISNFKQSLSSKDTYFNVNYTMMKRNIDELLDAVDYWDQLSLDQIYLIAMRVRPGGGKHAKETLKNIMKHLKMRLDEAALDVIENNRQITLASSAFITSDLAIKYPSNILHHIVKSDNPKARAMLNPRAYFQNGHYPGMPVNCRSPFKFIRIDYNGDVFLCQRFKIGNIAESSLIDIWNSEKANKTRALVHRSPGPCNNCDHYELCVKADQIDLNKDESLEQTVPELIGNHLDFSIIRIKRQFYGMPSEVIYDGAPITRNNKFQADTLKKLMSLITEYTLNKK